MKKLKIENISGIILDFFLIQNKETIRVVLQSGESTWCDFGSTTKSMILYERKNLIKISDASEENKTVSDKEIAKTVNTQVETLEVTNNLELITDIEYLQNNFFKSLGVNEDELKKDVSPVKENDESKIVSEKKYTGKKRGRKKKRGPKPGSKRKKAAPKTDIEEDKSE